MPQNLIGIEIRIRDRVGVVSEVTREIAALRLPIHTHHARIGKERSGEAISIFHAKISADETELLRLRRQISHIKGFRSFHTTNPTQ